MLLFLVFNIVLCLFYTLWVASLTLLERKILSIIQRRVGPDMVGYRGRLQFIADAIKLLAKGILIPNNVLKFEFIFLSIFSIFFVYTFWLNIVLEPDLLVIDLELSIVLCIIFSLMFAYSVLLVGFLSKNKYSLLASIRFSIVSINNELILSLLWLVFVFFGESFSFSSIFNNQFNISFIFIFLPILYVLFTVFLMELGRSPFDFGESESELVAGYTTELSGFIFVLYYLGEYFHLLVFSCIFSLCLFGF